MKRKKPSSYDVPGHDARPTPGMDYGTPKAAPVRTTNPQTVNSFQPGVRLQGDAVNVVHPPQRRSRSKRRA